MIYKTFEEWWVGEGHAYLWYNENPGIKVLANYAWEAGRRAGSAEQTQWRREVR